VKLARTLIVPATLAALAAAPLAPRAGAAGVPSCAAAQVSASFGGQGATQSLLGSVIVTNRAAAACLLSGRPVITFAGGPPHEVLREQATKPALEDPVERYSATIVLAPRHSASVLFQWFNWCDPQSKAPPTSAAAGGRRPSQVLVTLRPGAPAIVATVAQLRTMYLPVCGDPGAPSTISVSLWTPGR